MSSLDKLLASARDSDSKIKVGYEVECLTLRESFLHYHIGRDADKGFSNAEVAQLDSGALGVFVEEATFQISSPVAQPRQATARKILDEGTKDRPVRVGVLVILMSSCQISEQLYPRKPEARNAR